MEIVLNADPAAASVSPPASAACPGVHANRSATASSVEFRGFSVEFTPPLSSAWSSRRQTPPQRGVPRLQRGVPANRSRYSVEFRGFSVEFTPTDPATAWSSAASAWSSRQQIPLQRGVPRLQRGVPANRSRYSVEFRGFSVEFTPTDPATAWSSAASAWSSRQQIPLLRGVPRLQRGVHANRSRQSVESASACQATDKTGPPATDKTGPPRRVRDVHRVVSGWVPVVRSAEEERTLGEPGSVRRHDFQNRRSRALRSGRPARASTGTSARRVRRTF